MLQLTGPAKVPASLVSQTLPPRILRSWELDRGIRRKHPGQYGELQTRRDAEREELDKIPPDMDRTFRGGCHCHPDAESPCEPTSDPRPPSTSNRRTGREARKGHHQ